ncbi:hypothetical protein CENSYa_1762 [Cenarchaeum symbiosum A]|uniref:Uncharacterized protein n=1 Tax=Cenarchaeum symbiosum (strain A) TaxID=414004 RepID=A0RYF6_CENSY|nr:hypothetical protein CENSYa_1762 [Cenarchaeum symbiosum A]
MPDVECTVCKMRNYVPEGGKCTECLYKSEGRGEMMGPREYLIERAISSVRTIVGIERMSAILEYACMLLEVHGMSSPFVLREGRIDKEELYQALQDLACRGHMEVKGPVKDDTGTGVEAPQASKYTELVKTGHLDGLPDNIEFSLVEEHFTIDDSQIGRKMVLLVRALNCHTPRDIRRLPLNRHPLKLTRIMAESSFRIKGLLSGPPTKSPEWLCPGPWVATPYRKAGDDTHIRRVYWKSKGKTMPSVPLGTLHDLKGILERWPALAKHDFSEAHEEAKV